MREPKIGGNFEEQKSTAKQSEHPTDPRNRGNNRIFFKDRFERGGLFQYQAEQYFGDVGGGIVGENILADERSQGLDGNRNSLRELARELRGQQKSLESTREKRGKSCGKKAARTGRAAPRSHSGDDRNGAGISAYRAYPRLKDKEIFSYLNRIEKTLNENGFSARKYAGEDIKTLLAVYFEQNVTTEKFENADGERWILNG